MIRIIVFLFGTFAAIAADFSIVVIPDQHIETNGVAPWRAHAKWISKNRESKKIVGMFGTGDWSNANLAVAWNNGLSALARKPGFVWASALGNHDGHTYDLIGEQARYTPEFDALMYSKIKGKPYFGGCYSDPKTSSNCYVRFTAGGRQILAFVLEFIPRPAVIAWATSIIQANPARECWIFTHLYMTSTGALALKKDAYGDYGMDAADYRGDALAAWAVQHPTIRMIFCGHWVGGSYWRDGGYHKHRSDKTEGHRVEGFFTNYQDHATMRSQVLTLMEWTGNTVRVSLINTTTDTALSDPPPYELEWPEPIPAGALPEPPARKK